MFFGYVDESGNAGLKGGSRTYVLGCLLIEADRWPETFDRLISFRRWLRDEFGVPVRAEIKANYLLQNTGPFTALELSEGARFRIYRQSMRLQPKLGFRTFAVVIDKAKLPTAHPGRSAPDVARSTCSNALSASPPRGKLM